MSLLSALEGKSRTVNSRKRQGLLVISFSRFGWSFGSFEMVAKVRLVGLMFKVKNGGQSRFNKLKMAVA